MGLYVSVSMVRRRLKLNRNEMVNLFNTVMFYIQYCLKTGEYVLQKRNLVLKDGQEVPQSHIADQHKATGGRDTEHDRSNHN